MTASSTINTSQPPGFDNYEGEGERGRDEVRERGREGERESGRKRGREGERVSPIRFGPKKAQKGGG